MRFAVRPFWILPFGTAGRMRRSEAKERFAVSRLKKETKDVCSASVSAATPDECPIICIVEVSKPIYRFKAGNEDRDLPDVIPYLQETKKTPPVAPYAAPVGFAMIITTMVNCVVKANLQNPLPHKMYKIQNK